MIQTLLDARDHIIQSKSLPEIINIIDQQIIELANVISPEHATFIQYDDYPDIKFQVAQYIHNLNIVINELRQPLIRDYIMSQQQDQHLYYLHGIHDLHVDIIHTKNHLINRMQHLALDQSEKDQRSLYVTIDLFQEYIMLIPSTIRFCFEQIIRDYQTMCKMANDDMAQALAANYALDRMAQLTKAPNVN